MTPSTVIINVKRPSRLIPSIIFGSILVLYIGVSEIKNKQRDKQIRGLTDIINGKQTKGA